MKTGKNRKLQLLFHIISYQCFVMFSRTGSLGNIFVTNSSHECQPYCLRLFSDKIALHISNEGHNVSRAGNMWAS